MNIIEKSESDTQTSYPITKTVWSGKTKYCESVVIADSPTYGRMLFLDGEIQSASVDEHIYHESLVHPIMVASKGQYKRVLVVGGGEGATVREVLRWSVDEVVWVDIDTELVELCKEHLGWAPHVYTDPRVKFIGKDIREVLPTLGTFDIIILDLPDPDSESELYGPAMWSAYKSALTGHIVTHVGPVRPFGNIGDGVQRVWSSARAGGFLPWVSGFYQITIPSFQGSWGFWIDGMNPLVYTRNVYIPCLRVVDMEQLIQWAYPPSLWRKILESQNTNPTSAGGSCMMYMSPVCSCQYEYSTDED